MIAVLARLLAWWIACPAVARWGVVVLEMASLWWSSARAEGAGPVPPWSEFAHNGAHIVAYGLLGALVLLAFGQKPPWPRADALRAVLFAGAYGAVDEWHQSWVPGRSCSFADLASDLAGAALATLCLLGFVGGDRAARRFVPAALLAALAAVALATWTPY